MAILMMDTVNELMDRKALPQPRMALDAVYKAGDDSKQQAHDLITRFVSYRARAGRSSSDSYTVRARKILMDLESKWPELAAEPRQSPIDVQELFAAPGRGFSQAMITYPMVRADTVFFLVIAQEAKGTSVQLMAVPLQGGDAVPLGKVLHPLRYRNQYQMYSNYVTAACIGNDSCYVALNGHGIHRFDLSQPHAQQVIASKSLPDGVVQSLVVAEDSLFIGVGSGSILRAEMADERIVSDDALETLVSTRDSSVQSPLDARPGFGVPHLLFDQHRNRLLIVIQNTRDSGGKLELWERRLRDGNLKRIHELARPQRRHGNARLDGDMLTISDVWIARWNLKTGESNILANYSLGSLRPTRTLWIPYWSEPTLCQGAVWWIQHDATIGSFDFPDGDPEFYRVTGLTGKPRDSSDESYLVPVNDKHFLLYFAQKLWLATPKEE